MLVGGREAIDLDWFYRAFSWVPDAITATDLAEFLRTYSQPGALRAGFAYYRAMPADAAANQALREAGFRLTMPVLALGGARTEARARAQEPERSLREIAGVVEGGVIPECGHFMPEEQPELLTARLIEHFRRG